MILRIACFWVLCCTVVRGATYFVDPATGNDGNAGTSQGSPWAHLPGTVGGGPVIQLQPGDSVTVKGGSTNNVSVNFDDTTYHGNAAFSSVLVQSGHLLGTPWGSGRAIFDEQNTRFYGFGVGKGSGNPINGLTLDGFEVRNIAGSASSGAPGNPGSCCISVQPPPSGGVPVAYIIIRNCYLHDALRTVSDTGHGMEIGVSSNMLVYYNLVGPNIGSKGIEFSGAQGVVSNNYITSTGDHCMSATRATNYDIVGNLIVQDFHSDGSSTVHGPTYMMSAGLAQNCDFWNNVGYDNYSGFTSNGWTRAVGWYNGTMSNRWFNNSFTRLGDNQDNGGVGSSLGMGANSAGTTNSFNQYVNNIQLNWTNPSGNAFIIYNGNASFDNNSSITLNFNDWFNGIANQTVCGWNDGSYHFATIGTFSFAPVTSFLNNLNIDPVLTGGSLPTGLNASFQPNQNYFALTHSSPSTVRATANVLSGDATHGYSHAANKFSLDILGTPRVNWSMGAYEYGASTFLLTGQFFWGQNPQSALPTGATIWLKPETVTNATGVNLSYWPDSSGNGYNYGATTSFLVWTNNQLNGFGGAYGTGTAAIRGTNASPVTANIAGASLFCVMKVITAGAFDTLVNFRAGTTFQRDSFTMTAGSLLSWQGRTLDADSVSTVGTLGANPTSFFLLEAIINYSTGNVKVYTNGTLVANSSPLTHANTSNTSSSATPEWVSTIASTVIGVEMLLYTNTLSDASRTNVIEPYFGWKYRLPIKSTP